MLSKLEVVAMAGLLGLAACEGPKGDTGPVGPAGEAGPPGTTVHEVSPGSQADAGLPAPPEAASSPMASGSAVGLSERARRGLEISPVALSLAGKSAADVERIAQGSYLVNALGYCDGCHDSADGRFLAGGTTTVLDDAGHVVYRRNLTPDPDTGLKLTEAQFVESLRTGKDFAVPAGMPPQQLQGMPWLFFRWLATEDIKAIYAYLKAVPPVANKILPDNKGPVLSAPPPVPFPGQYNEGDVDRPLPPETDGSNLPVSDPQFMLRGLAIRPLAAPADLGARSAGEQRAIGRGSYLVNSVAHCSGCHTNPPRIGGLPPTDPRFLDINTANYLSGGRVFPVAPQLGPTLRQTRTMSANLSGAANGYLNKPGTDFSSFLTTLTQGMKMSRAGMPRALGSPMPFEHFRRMALDDLEAIWTYLKTIPPRTGMADKTVQEVARFCAKDGDCVAGETCNVASKECVGGACASNADCGACQSCTGGRCAAPAPGEACLTQGL
jgi:mono/diheme cytochrome c family protein